MLNSMLFFSFLQGPILAVTFGQQIQNQELRNLGVKSEIRGLGLCLVVGTYMMTFPNFIMYIAFIMYSTFIKCPPVFRGYISGFDNNF